MGERWPITAIFNKHSTSSAAPIPQTIPIGGSSRPKELRSINLADTTKHGSTMQARSKSNLGLSYVLSKDLPKAEETLRRAYSRADAGPRVRQNLALVVGLRGRLAEAESILTAGRPAEEAAASVAYLRRLLSHKANARTQADTIPVTATARPD
jgi:hypothetical protein